MFALSAAGIDVFAALPAAAAKDGGVEPATLAWVVGAVPLDTSELLLRRAVDADALRVFRDGVVATLQTLAWPDRG